MFEDFTFEEWHAIVKKEAVNAGLSLPEDIELLELAHMECRADDTSVEEFIQQLKKEQDK